MRLNPTGLALALLAAALWGLAPVAIKGALDGYSPDIINPIRLGAAALFFRAAAGRDTPWLPADAWSYLAGIALGVDFILYNYGVKLTSAAVAGLVVNVEVVATIALAVWLLGERLDGRRVAGSLLTLGGVVYVASEGVSLADLTAPDKVIGNVLVMLAGIAWSFYAVAQRRAPRQRNAFRLMAPIFVVATLTTMPLLLSPAAWEISGGIFPTAMLLAVTLLCTMLVYLVYARCQELVDVSVLSIVIAAIPIFALVFAWLLLGEEISSRVIAGGALVFAGVLLIATDQGDKMAANEHRPAQPEPSALPRMSGLEGRTSALTSTDADRAGTAAGGRTSVGQKRGAAD
jgi:drug/metabolite transporter (DMT)-like permease